MAALTRSPRQGLLGGVMVTLLAEAVAIPAGIITAAVLTRGLGPAAFGSFTVVASTVATLEWLLIAILARPVVKFVAEADDWRSVAATSFRAYVVAGLFVATATWVLAGTAARALGDPALATYFRMFAPQIPLFAAGAACKGILAGLGRYRQQAAASAVSWIGRVAFIVLFVQLGWGIHGAILGSISGTLAGAIMALGLTGSAVWGRAGFPVKQLMQLALPAFVAMLFARLLDQVGILALEALGDNPAEVGYFGAAMSVLMVTSMIAAAVTPALVSTLTSARYAGDEVAVESVARGAIRFGLVLFPFAAIVAGAADEIVALLFGQAFLPTAPLMAWLIVGAIARANVVVIASVLVAVGRAWTAALVAIPLPLLAVAAHTVAIPRYGALGAAVVSAVFALAGAVASVLVVCAVEKLPLPLPTIVRSALVAAAAYALAAAWPTPGGLVLVKATVLGVAVPLGLVLAGELTRNERSELRRLLPSR